MSKIKIIVGEPNKKPYTKLINAVESELYGLVYYPYIQYELEDNIWLVYSKEAIKEISKIFPFNRSIYNRDIYGAFVIVKKKKDKYVTLTDREIEEIKSIIGNIE